ncbi:unnamed protein product [Arctia plantaginis]|uniref:Uncharacterized protein n=1 Tax=Arctia plantaginis TaxID=874455 RepID=A0A8S0Z643_ARCPL|nr:unnamed protein product [Arctia plantaginis]
MRISRNKTGGGNDYFPPDEVLAKVASLLGNTCTGFSVEFGGDATISNVPLVMAEIENVEPSGNKGWKRKSVRPAL